MRSFPVHAIVVALLCAIPTQEPELQLVSDWIDAVRAHQPGQVDPPLLQVSAEDPHGIDFVRRKLPAVLRAQFSRAERNDILRRGAVLHMDIALLLPEQAAKFTQEDVTPQVDPYARRPEVRHEADSTVFSMDGEMVATATDSAHWWMGSELLKHVLPHPGSDPFVARWHRAVIAHFESMQLFGSANYAIKRAMDVVPGDPWVVFYAGVMHEANASALIQSIPLTAPGVRQSFRFPPPEAEWRRAEKLLRQTISANGPIEAQVRLGRVLGRLGKHEDATATLKGVVEQLKDSRLQYLANLFLGREEGELGHVAAARDALDRAATLFPTAQAPVITLSEMYWHAGDRSAALAALDRLQQLPSDSRDRLDPWWTYFESYAADADAQIDGVRAAVAKGNQP